MVSKAAAGAPVPWYNTAPNERIPMLGIASPSSVGNADAQVFFTAVNKRLIRNWMAELGYCCGDDPELRAALTEWMGTEDGKKHFRNWAEKLGCQIGNRPNDSRGPHKAMKALDINYEFNPWCPLCGHEIGTNRFAMTGEDGTQQWWPMAGRLYDRVLRIFVPTQVAADDPSGARRFAKLFYRAHSDWTPSTFGPEDQLPLSIGAVYRRYQMLNWSLRFYFNYRYAQIVVTRLDADRQTPAINAFNNHNAPAGGDPPPMPTGTAVWAAIVDDIARGRLPPTAELVLEENSVPVALRTGLFAPFNARIRYPFMAADTTVYRVPLTSAQVAAFAAVHAEQTIGAAAATQIETDHRDFANAIRYSGTNRDPCNGIFNHSYEFVLAVGRMLSDAGQVRAFGAFATFAAGDMQHFDYGHGHR